MATPKQGTLQWFIDHLKLEDVWPDIADKDKIKATTEWIAKYNACKTQQQQIILVLKWCQDLEEDPQTKAARLEAEKLIKEAEERRLKEQRDEEDRQSKLLRDEEDRQSKKLANWHLEKFEVTDGAYMSGKLAAWIRKFERYCEMEKVNDETACKALQLKGGTYIVGLMDTITVSVERNANLTYKEKLTGFLGLLKQKAKDIEDTAVAVSVLLQYD